MKELPIPSTARLDPSARELARVWVAGGAQHVALDGGAWRDPAAWGLVLVDLARHAADAYAQAHGCDASEVLTRIREAFDVEWETPTDEHSASTS